MPERTIDLSGQYVIESLSATEMVLASPEQVNPNWNYVDLDGSGTTGYAQNISIISAPVYVPVDLQGTYTVTAVTPTTITLFDPEIENADWGFLSLFPGLITKLTSAYVAKSGGNWIGPFIVDGPDTSLLVANFVADSGLFKDNGKKQKAFPISVEIEATPVDSDDEPIGSPQTFSATLPGNDKGRERRAITLVCELTAPGRQSVRARRTTAADYAYKGTVVDEIKWQDLFGLSAVNMDDFGDVTTVHSRTYATEGALAVKERQLNMLATRIVARPGDDPIATTNAADVFTAICLDPYLGARSDEELDLAGIQAAVAEAIAYFGSDLAGQFNYTFDDDKVSFEEMVTTVAQACFCTPFRQGSTIGLSFERAVEDSTLLLNHRNKLPGSETRTVRFGNLDDHDGVEAEYRDPDDDSSVTIYIPADRSAVNPREVKLPGVRSRQQAYWQAWRAWNRIRFQNTATEFRALQEAAILGRNERVLIVDNTRADSQDGEVLSQDGLALELSLAVALTVGVDFQIFLQLPDGSVESIPITVGDDAYHVVLARAPRLELAIGADLYASATYQIAAESQARSSAFLIAEKDPEDNFTFTLRAVNYSFLYYANDQLALWLDFQQGYLDAGPYRRDGEAGGSAAIDDDATRGNVHRGTGSGDRVDLPAFDAPASYTKAFWVSRDSTSGAGSVLSSTSTHERIAFGPTDVNVYHEGALLSSSFWPGSAGEWHHGAVCYDDDTAVLTVYVDGELYTLVDGVIGRSTLSTLHAVGYNGGDGLAGAVDDLRLYTRALSKDEVRELYRSTRL
jgi:hypothetical protein